MRRPLIRLLEAVAVFVSIATILVGLVIWRLSSAPLSLDPVKYWLVDALLDGRAGVTLALGETSVSWGGWRDFFQVRARDAELKGAAGPTALFETIVNEAAALDAANLPVDRLMRALRLMKRRASLCVAVADITDSWPLAEITRALTRMAETALAQAFRHALATTVARGRLPLTLGDDPLVDSGLICLAMGKMGAYELNYSSDIDLIVFYDNEHPALAGFDEVRRGFVEVTRVMVRIMEERTAEGYVFRTDLR